MKILNFFLNFKLNFKSNLKNLKKHLFAFSIIELTVSLIAISCITAAFTPVIVKKMKNNGVAVTGKKIFAGQKCKDWVNEKCAICYVDKCLYCTNECSEGKYRNETDCTCIKCAENCLQCNSLTSCKTCKEGYTGEKCDQCIQGYGWDSTNKTCNKCSGTQYSDGGNNSCAACPSGYICSNGIKQNCPNCSICNGGIVQYCQAGCGWRSDINQCSSCASVSSIFSSSKTYYNVGGNKEQCKECPDGAYCSYEKITSCKKGYGWYESEKTCKKCASNQYSIDKNTEPCKNCSEGYVCNGTDITGCQAGYGWNAFSQTCSKCSGNTYSAGGTSACSGCGTNQIPNANHTGCVQGCALSSKPEHANWWDGCSNFTCDSGYYPNGNTCSSCSAKWGDTCSTCKSDTCSTCSSNQYEVKNNKCEQKKCGKGKYLDTNGNCQSCPDGEYNDKTEYNDGTTVTSCTKCGDYISDCNKETGELKTCVKEARKYKGSCIPLELVYLRKTTVEGKVDTASLFAISYLISSNSNFYFSTTNTGKSDDIINLAYRHQLIIPASNEEGRDTAIASKYNAVVESNTDSNISVGDISEIGKGSPQQKTFDCVTGKVGGDNTSATNLMVCTHAAAEKICKYNGFRMPSKDEITMNVKVNDICYVTTDKGYNVRCTKKTSGCSTIDPKGCYPGRYWTSTAELNKKSEETGKFYFLEYKPTGQTFPDPEPANTHMEVMCIDDSSNYDLLNGYWLAQQSTTSNNYYYVVSKGYKESYCDRKPTASICKRNLFYAFPF